MRNYEFLICLGSSTGSSVYKENEEPDSKSMCMKSENFAVSLRKSKKKELISLKRVKNLTAKCASFSQHDVEALYSGHSISTMSSEDLN